MLHVRFAPLVERLRDLDALILIDTPPVLPVSDARLIAPHCDGVLVVVSAGQAKPVALQRRSSGSRSCTRNLLGLILQPVRPGPRGDRRLLLHEPGAGAAV